MPGHQRVLLRMAAGVVVFIAAVLFDAVRRFIFRAWDKLFVRCSCASAATGRFQRWISGKFAVFTAEPADRNVGTSMGVETGTSVGADVNASTGTDTSANTNASDYCDEDARFLANCDK